MGKGYTIIQGLTMTNISDQKGLEVIMCILIVDGAFSSCNCPFCRSCAGCRSC
jgi:hypothetical protein